MTDPLIPTLIALFQSHSRPGQQTAGAPPPAPRPRSLFPGLRGGTLTNQNLYYRRMQGGIWDDLQTAIYTVSLSMPLQAVVGIQPDGTPLWLDDDTRDDDFSRFVRDEELATWVPDQFDALVSLLIETKCAYLFDPRLVVSSDDIPSRPARVQAMLTPEERAEETARRAAIAPLVHPPRWISRRDGDLQVEAWVWTPFLGRLFAMTWVLAPTGLVSFGGVEHSNQIGAWTVPR